MGPRIRTREPSSSSGQLGYAGLPKAHNPSQGFIRPVDASPAWPFSWLCRPKPENEIEEFPRCSERIVELLRHPTSHRRIQFQQVIKQLGFCCLEPSTSSRYFFVIRSEERRVGKEC